MNQVIIIHPRDAAAIAALMTDARNSAHLGDDAHSEVCVAEAEILLQSILEEHPGLTLGDYDPMCGGSFPIMSGRIEAARFAVHDGHLVITLKVIN